MDTISSEFMSLTVTGISSYMDSWGEKGKEEND